MKNLFLLDPAGNIRPGRPTIEAIDAVLEGRDIDRLATVQIDEGGIAATLLSDSELDALRGEMAQRRNIALIAVLDAALALHRAAEGIPGVTPPYGSVSVECAEAPWAEQVVLNWAHDHNLYVTNAPPPTESGKWVRHCEVTLREQAWSPTIVSICWPEVEWSGAEMIARDAEAEGRLSDAKAIRQDAQDAVQDEKIRLAAGASLDDEMPF